MMAGLDRKDRLPPHFAMAGDVDKRVEIQPTRVWPVILAAFWAGEALFGLILAGLGISWIGDEDWLVVATVMGGALLLVFFGVLMGAASWAVVGISGPVIVMDRTGFLDRRLTDQVIPWKAMRWGVFATAKGARSLQFRTDPTINLKVKWPMRLMGRVNEIFRYPPHTVMTLGTGKSVQDLADMISEFRQPSY